MRMQALRLRPASRDINVWPKWHKPYVRMAAALEGLSRFRGDDPSTLKEALEAYQDAFAQTT